MKLVSTEKAPKALDRIPRDMYMGESFIQQDRLRSIRLQIL